MSKILPLLLLCFMIVVNCSVVKEEVEIYELKNGKFSVNFTNWGATIMSLVVPDKYGNLTDIVLGFDSIERYKNDHSYFGSIVGRVANLIGGAQFTFNGISYKLKNNSRDSILHGGRGGFSDVVWKVKKHKKDGESPSITFAYNSADGEEGFPGDLLVRVTYSVIGFGPYQLSVKMRAKSVNKATPVSMAQHSYWNLGGHNSGDILSHDIQIFSSHITPKDINNLPTGAIENIKGTPYDFLEPQTIGSKMSMLKPTGSGYDINYVIDNGGKGHKMKPAAMVHNKKSGIVMELWTNAPGMQFYTANFVYPVKGKAGSRYQPHAGLCLESQGFPDAVNHPTFPSQIVTPGQTYKHDMLYTFSTKDA